MTTSGVSKLVIVIHAFLKSLSSSVWMLQLSSLLTADPDTAVLLVGWGHGSGGSPFLGGEQNHPFLALSGAQGVTLSIRPYFQPELV